MNKHKFYFYEIIFILVCTLAVAAQEHPAHLSGKWQISWEARIGTEQETMQLDQSGANLTGTIQGHLGTNKISGTIDGKNVTLNAEIQGTKTFNMVFHGVIEGDKATQKMSGKFDIENVTDAYDWHGENVRPINYTWSAIRP